MKISKAGNRVNALFYLLTFYILLQFFWWAYLLITLNSELYLGKPERSSKILMVVGEGAVFFTFLLIGIWFMQRTIRKEINLVRQQRNFLLSITHELKTPIAAIKLCLETLKAHQNLPLEKQQALQKNALSNTERLQKLIENVLLATQIENDVAPIRKEETDLSKLCSEIILKTRRDRGEDVKINSEFETSVIAFVDPSAIESILINLIDNALKYAGEAPIEVLLERESNKAVLTVADQGPGIPKDQRDVIFEKFVRLENEETRSQKGTGLGMFIVNQLVELHQGQISLDSNSPTGLVIKVSIPLS